MLDEIRSLFADGDELSALQMALRAFVVYVTAIVFVKLGEKRFMGRSTAFDMILGIMLGSVLSRAITGNADFAPTIAAAAVLVGLHWLFAVASYHLDGFGALVKGGERVLIENGEIRWDNMRKSHISRRDLDTALYTSGRVTDPSEVKVARFERSGEISVVAKDPPATELRVIEVSVEAGVQTVRLEITR